jgi:GT2 family glycosyltransferase
MLNRLKKTPATCTTQDARFLLLLCLGREPYMAAELETYTDQSFFGALKRVLKSAAFSHSLFDPFVLNKKPMQVVFSAEQSTVVLKGLSRHFQLDLKGPALLDWLETLTEAFSTTRMQKAFLSVHDPDRLQYLQTQLAHCSHEDSPAVFGAVHQSSGKNIRGYAAQADNETPLVLDFYIDGYPAGTSTADQANPEISETHHVGKNTAFSHTLDVREPEGLTDSCLLVFERETGVMVCPPKNLVLSVKAAVQTAAKVRGVLDELLAAHEAGDDGQISKQLTALDERLPLLEQYRALRLKDYPLYRKVYATPRPQNLSDLNLTLLVTLAEGDKDACKRTERSLAAQSYQQFSVVKGEPPADISGFDLQVCLNPGDLLDQHALGWLATAAKQNPKAIILRAGHDHYSETKDAGYAYSDPAFINEFDPLILEQRPDYACAFAVNLNIAGRAATHGQEQGIWQDVCSQYGAEAFVTVDEILFSFPICTQSAVNKPLSLPNPDMAKKLAIIIPTKDKLDVLKPCIESLLKTISDKNTTEIIIVDNGSQEATTKEWLSHIQQEKPLAISVQSYNAPFNWADINNKAVAQSDADYYLFLNNDTLATESGWDVTLRQLLALEKVGVIGAKLLFEDDTIQHAGVVLNNDSLAIHEGAGQPTSATGYADRLALTRQCEAVTGAFLACSKETFVTVGGFDAESFPVTFNDIDFCFKVSEAEQQVIYSPLITFYLWNLSAGAMTAPHRRKPSAHAKSTIDCAPNGPRASLTTVGIQRAYPPQETRETP